VEYEIAGNSILVIRQRDGSVKALHNVCRNRATQLAKGCGRLPGGRSSARSTGWRWNLDGSSSFVFIESAFDPACIEPEELRLRECWSRSGPGCVINMTATLGP